MIQLSILLIFCIFFTTTITANVFNLTNHLGDSCLDVSSTTLVPDSKQETFIAMSMFDLPAGELWLTEIKFQASQRVCMPLFHNCTIAIHEYNTYPHPFTLRKNILQEPFQFDNKHKEFIIKDPHTYRSVLTSTAVLSLDLRLAILDVPYSCQHSPGENNSGKLTLTYRFGDQLYSTCFNIPFKITTPIKPHQFERRPISTIYYPLSPSETTRPTNFTAVMLLPQIDTEMYISAIKINPLSLWGLYFPNSYETPEPLVCIINGITISSIMPRGFYGSLRSFALASVTIELTKAESMAIFNKKGGSVAISCPVLQWTSHGKNTFVDLIDVRNEFSVDVLVGSENLQIVDTFYFNIHPKDFLILPKLPTITMGELARRTHDSTNDDDNNNNNIPTNSNNLIDINNINNINSKAQSNLELLIATRFQFDNDTYIDRWSGLQFSTLLTNCLNDVNKTPPQFISYRDFVNPRVPTDILAYDSPSSWVFTTPTDKNPTFSTMVNLTHVAQGLKNEPTFIQTQATLPCIPRDASQPTESIFVLKARTQRAISIYQESAMVDFEYPMVANMFDYKPIATSITAIVDNGKNIFGLSLIGVDFDVSDEKDVHIKLQSITKSIEFLGKWRCDLIEVVSGSDDDKVIQSNIKVSSLYNDNDTNFFGDEQQQNQNNPPRRHPSILFSFKYPRSTNNIGIVCNGVNFRSLFFRATDLETTDELRLTMHQEKAPYQFSRDFFRRSAVPVFIPTFSYMGAGKAIILKAIVVFIPFAILIAISLFCYLSRHSKKKNSTTCRPCGRINFRSDTNNDDNNNNNNSNNNDYNGYHQNLLA